MADDFGLSFAPINGRQGYQADLDPVQEAIQILSLRRPTVLGAQAPVAPGLFGPPSGAPDISALLQTLMKQFGSGQYKLPPLPKTMDTGAGTLSGSFPGLQAPKLGAPTIGFQQPGKEMSGTGSLLPQTPPNPMQETQKDRYL